MVAPNSEPTPPPQDDAMGPPATPVEVECIHCGSVYMSDKIRWQPDANGPGGGWWTCPVAGCDGAGFCFDIFPTDPKVAEQFGVHAWEGEESEKFDPSGDEANEAKEPNEDDEEDEQQDVAASARGRKASGRADAQPPPRRRKLKVDVADLTEVMDFRSQESQSFLDLSTGVIHTLDDDLLRRVEDDEIDDMPAWEAELVDIARAVLEDDGNRFAEITHIDSADSFDLMRAFVGREITDAVARQQLERAITGPKPFRRFKDALLDFPALRERWFAFEARAKQEIARQWLDEIGVDVIER